MASTGKRQVHEIMVGQGREIKPEIESFLLDRGWKAAYISGAIGSVQDVDLTVPADQGIPPKMEHIALGGPGEVLAFTGEAMEKSQMPASLKAVYQEDGSPLFIHIHMSMAVSGGRIYGGGLREGSAFRGLKIYIQRQDDA